MGVKLNKFLWGKPPIPLRISREECHVWKVDLRAVNKENFQLDILSKDEQKRLSSFKFAKDRFRYGVTQSLKRWVLASYLNERPEKLVFTREKYGKPAILSQKNWPHLQFNISHSNQIILLGITVEDPIGIDVEYHADNISVENLSEFIFSPLERAYFSKLASQQEKKEAFFRCWTRKEAYLKAEGMGLNDFLPNISVDMSEFPKDDRVETLALNKKENLPWRLFPLPVDKFYTAAVVVGTHYPKRLVAYTANC
jgi:4'-phosphopantetheinyl transferase